MRLLRVGAGAFLLVATSLSGTAGPVRGQEAEERPWGNTADLSLLITDGNSETVSFAASDEFTYTTNGSSLELVASALRTRTSDRQLTNVGGNVVVDETSRTTAEAYGASGKYSRDLAPGVLAFTGLAWERDRLAGIDNRYTFQAGLGYRLLDTECQKLTVELGGDYIDEDPVGGAGLSHFGGRVSLLLERALTPTSKLQSELEVLENLEELEDVRANWVASVTARLSETFALKLGYALRFDNRPVQIVVPGTGGAPDALFRFDETDSRITASLVVDF